jgi:uncharacterized membrane protein
MGSALSMMIVRLEARVSRLDARYCRWSIVGLPLLYTMEMWWHGETLSSWHLLVLLGSILVLNFLFDLVSGFREEYSVSGAISEAISSLGIGIVFSAVVLWLIGELHISTGPVEWAGKILPKR